MNARMNAREQERKNTIMQGGKKAKERERENARTQERKKERENARTEKSKDEKKARKARKTRHDRGWGKKGVRGQGGGKEGEKER